MTASAALRVGVAVPAAGSGRRMGGARKPYLELRGEPVLVHALRPLLARSDVVAVRVALAPADAAAPPAWLAGAGADARVAVVAGGAERADSVRSALEALPDDLDVVVVHDGARPLLTGALLERCIRAAAGGVGAVAGFPAVDTLKEVDAAGRVLGTPERARFWHAQTPQAFPAAMLRAAYRAAGGAGKGGSAAGGAAKGASATDDAALVERAGGTVVMVASSPRNLKVTRPGDLALAERLLEEEDEERAAETGR